MKLASRILIALFAVAGAIGWCLVPVMVAWLGKAMHGMSDGAGTESGGSVPLPRLLLLGSIWLVPMAGFILMFFNALNLLKGVMRRIAYWYSLMFLLIAGVGLLLLFPFYYRALKWVGLAFILCAGLWGFAFRENVSSTEKQQTPAG